MKEENSFTDVSPDNIWNYRQNHPELVVRDIESLFPGSSKYVRLSLMARGVNKWLKVRRDLIAYKKIIKHEVKRLSALAPILKDNMTTLYVDYKDNNTTPYDVHEYHIARQAYLINKEKLKLLQEVRGSLKSLCMTDRWQVWENKKLEEMNTLSASD